jgi:hypothetical protein
MSLRISQINAQIFIISLHSFLYQAPEITQTLLSPFHRNSKSGLVYHFLVWSYHLFYNSRFHLGFLSLSRSFYHPGKGDKLSKQIWFTHTPLSPFAYSLLIATAKKKDI